MSIIIGMLISLALSIVAYMIMPKPKQEMPEIQNMDDPTSEAGLPKKVVFGTLTIKSLNCLGSWEKRYVKSKVKA